MSTIQAVSPACVPTSLCKHCVCFLHRFTTQISQYGVRAQIVAYYYSLTSLLDDVPSVRQSHFMIGQVGEPKVMLDSGVELCPNPR